MLICWVALSNKWYKTNDTVRGKMYKHWERATVFKQHHCALGPECYLGVLLLYFRLCIRSPKGSKNSGHGKKFETLNFTINKKY